MEARTLKENRDDEDREFEEILEKNKVLE